MPYIGKGRRLEGGYAPSETDRPNLPRPDQGRYGPTGTTDSPRYRSDGTTPWPHPPKGDPKP